ncbi:hypothetical protein A6R68_24079, partial [Neotoma lepida]
MEHSNECKRNFVAVYDGSSAIENLKAKFCSTVANDVMLKTGVGVIRMWADEGSRLSRFRMLFTSFVEPPCTSSTFFCHSNMCINNSLVCNGVQNCAYPWDENHCKEKKKAGLFEQITKTHGTIIGITSGIVLVLLIISILVQVKQPRKKVMACKTAFNKTGFQEVFDPPHYELFSLREKEISADLADLSEELDNYQKMRRSSTASRCIHDHHCGSQASSVKQSRTNLSSMELPFRNDFAQPQPMKTFNSTFKKSSYTFKQAHECPEQSLEDRVMEEIPCEIYEPFHCLVIYMGFSDSEQGCKNLEYTVQTSTAETPTPKPFSHQVYKDLQREDCATLRRHRVNVDSLVPQEQAPIKSPPRPLLPGAFSQLPPIRVVGSTQHLFIAAILLWGVPRGVSDQ